MNESELISNEKPRHAGMFKPGQSGNPSGRPKSDENIRELCKAYTSQAIQTLIEVAGNKKASPSARVQAATAILDRGWGKPTQHIESVNMGMSYIDFLEQSANQRIQEEETAMTSISISSNPMPPAAESNPIDEFADWDLEDIYDN